MLNKSKMQPNRQIFHCVFCLRHFQLKLANSIPWFLGALQIRIGLIASRIFWLYLCANLFNLEK